MLSISLEQSKITNPEILDWLVSPEIKAGTQTNKYWMMTTSLQVDNPQGDHQIEILNKLCFLCKAHSYNFLIIRK